MNKQYVVTVRNSVGNSFITTVFAKDWSEIPAVIKQYGCSDYHVHEYHNTPRDFCERYPELMTEHIIRTEETKRRMRELFKTPQ